MAWTQEEMSRPCQMPPIGETCPAPCPWLSLPRGEKPLCATMNFSNVLRAQPTCVSWAPTQGLRGFLEKVTAELV